MFTHYVAGFAFSKDASKVVLIRKNRPKWQAGLLNAVGGHVEEGETPLWAMGREYQEETGVCNALEDWTLFATLEGGTKEEGYMVNFYYSTEPSHLIVNTMTDEKVDVYYKGCWDTDEMMHNLPWLIEAARDCILNPKQKVFLKVDQWSMPS